MADAATANWPPLPKERTKGLKDLQELYWNKLRKHKAYIMPMLRHARYPLIALQDRHSGIDVQIVLSNDTSLSREIMNGYMQEYPYLRQLYYVIKTTFLIRGLSDVFRGGFGSYSLFMMIVASIRHNPHPRNDAAGALVNFLKFWRDFDTTKQGVSVEPAVLYDKTSMPMTDTVRAKLEVSSPSRSSHLPANPVSARTSQTPPLVHAVSARPCRRNKRSWPQRCCHQARSSDLPRSPSTPRVGFAKKHTPYSPWPSGWPIVHAQLRPPSQSRSIWEAADDSVAEYACEKGESHQGG